jgi:hypothetical protein
MVSATYANWQRSPVPISKERMQQAGASAIEIHVPIEHAKADRTLWRILILPLDATASDPHVDQLRAASNTHDRSTDAAGDRFRLGPQADEEPTWEDAEWQ